MTDTTQRELALVTGASSGLGAEFARTLGVRGFDLVITARREDRLRVLEKEITEAHPGTTVHVIAADLGTAAGVEALVTAVDALARPVTVLVNNAGYGVHGPFVEHDATRLDQMLQLNMTSLTRLTHHYARAMVARRRGKILLVASIGAYQPSPYYAAYSATKAYVLFLGEALQHELRGTGVSCTTLCPGLTGTEFHEVAQHPKTGIVAATMMTARSVATIGLDAMVRGRAVVTPGFINKLNAFFVKLMPRSLATWVAGVMMKK